MKQILRMLIVFCLLQLVEFISSKLARPKPKFLKDQAKFIKKGGKEFGRTNIREKVKEAAKDVKAGFEKVRDKIKLSP